MKITVYKNTTDNWCGNFKIEGDCRVSDLVQVNLSQLLDGEWRVSVWGNDDLGMDLDFKEEEFFKAKSLFLGIIQLEDVTIEKMKEFGLDYF